MILLHNEWVIVNSQEDVDARFLAESGDFRFLRSGSRSNLDCSEAEMTFGFVFSGSAQIERKDDSAHFQLAPGMYFAADSSWAISWQGTTLIIGVKGYCGLNVFGGPIEENGRLNYIDSCTDSLLIPPTKLGDPCLNLLVFPPGIKQTPHTHPSFRAGVVISGSGVCVTSDLHTPLYPGDFFFIPAYLQHCFHSSNEKGLRVLAFHPDSDFGPTDSNHPMVNRTIIDKK